MSEFDEGERIEQRTYEVHLTDGETAEIEAATCHTEPSKEWWLFYNHRKLLSRHLVAAIRKKRVKAIVPEGATDHE